jgi:hypothetical protein
MLVIAALSYTLLGRTHCRLGGILQYNLSLGRMSLSNILFEQLP